MNIFADIGRYPKLITVSKHMFKDVGQCQKTQLIPRTFLKIYIGQCPNDAKSYATIIYILYLGQNRKSKLVSTALFYIFSGRVFSSSFFSFFFFLPFFLFLPHFRFSIYRSSKLFSESMSPVIMPKKAWRHKLASHFTGYKREL